MLSIKHNEDLPHAQPLFPLLSPLCMTSCTSRNLLLSMLHINFESRTPHRCKTTPVQCCDTGSQAGQRMGVKRKKNDTPKGSSQNLSLCWNKAHLSLLFTFYSSSEMVENISFNILDKIATCSFLEKGFSYYSSLINCSFSRHYWEKLRKYSSIPATEKSWPSRSGAHERTQMKLFTSQRDLYISGFLFFWLVLRHLVTLINWLAKELSNKT